MFEEILQSPPPLLLPSGCLVTRESIVVVTRIKATNYLEAQYCMEFATSFCVLKMSGMSGEIPK